MRVLGPDVTTAALEHEALPPGERIDLAPGVAVRLTAGDRTVWTVTERVRKLWLARRSQFGPGADRAAPARALSAVRG